MPVSPNGFYAACGRYECRSSSEDYCREQEKLNRIARSQHQKIPERSSALSLLLFSGVLLPGLLRVSHAQASLAEISLPTPSCVSRMLYRPNILSGTACIKSAPFPTATAYGAMLPVSGEKVDCTDRFSLATKPRNIVRTQQILTTAGRKHSALLSLPVAAAEPASSGLDFLLKDEAKGMLIAESDAAKRMILSIMRSFLVHMGGFSNGRINELEFQWSVASANTPITLTRIDVTSGFLRNKRISMADRERGIAMHIAKHCAEEAEIFHSSGLSEGKLLIFKAQRIENPFRMLYDNIEGYTPSDTVQSVGNGVNFLLNMLTLGLKPLFSGLFANYYRQKYYEDIGDEICATRQKHISFAQFATALDIESGVYLNSVKSRIKKPMDLANIIPYSSRADYFSRNAQDNVETELLIYAHRKSAAGLDEKVLLKSKGDDVFDVAPSTVAETSRDNTQVIYDRDKNIWRNKDVSDSILVNVEIVEGESLIKIQGDTYPLHVNNKNHYEIFVTRQNGEQEYLPVYSEALSKTWHLARENQHPIFTHFQKRLIDRINVPESVNFKYHGVETQNPQFYGSGKIFEVRNRHEIAPSIPALYTVVEMNGKLVPVRRVKNQDYVTYEVFDIHSPLKKGHVIEWDGERWTFEKWTSAHASPLLIQHVTPEFYSENLAVHSMSAADQQGLKWISGKSYLKIKNRYVEIHLGQTTYISQPDGRKMMLEYINQQFFPMLHSRELTHRVVITTEAKIDAFYDEITDHLKRELAENNTIFDFQELATQFFSPVPTHVEPVTSTALDKKRFIVAAGDEQFVLETTRYDKTCFLLRGNESDAALRKYYNKFVGDNIKLATSLQRESSEYDILPGSRSQIDTFSYELIEFGASLIERVLNRTHHDMPQTRMIVVGHADFFDTSRFENNVFSSADNIYKALVDFFIPLSKKFPDAIIIPGSIYLAQDVTELITHRGLTYRQMNEERLVSDAINFFAAIVPVLHQGRFVTIARKGEYITYMHADLMGKPSQVRLGNLDEYIPHASTLQVWNFKNDIFGDRAESIGARTGAIFAGKTLMPNEKAITARYLFPERNNARRYEVEALFNNEFLINGDKFLIVVDDEFVQHGANRPLVRSLAFPRGETEEMANRYDWIIHPAAGSGLDTVMRSAGDNYLRADRFIAGECVTEFNHRTHSITYLDEWRLFIYDFVSN